MLSRLQDMFAAVRARLRGDRYMVNAHPPVAVAEPVPVPVPAKER